MTARLSTLANGLRVASYAMPSSQTAAVGIWCAVGARHEPARIGGISHFLEHLLFKGTKKRTARRISEEVEGVGGDLNAYTAEERTCYYATAASEHFSRVTGVLADMYFHSLLDADEVERERGVIVEEIEMIRDEPAQHVQELLTAETWRGDALGRPITGTKKSLAAITRRDLKTYLKDHYHASQTILTAAGDVDHDEIVTLAEKLLGKLPKAKVSLRKKTKDSSSAAPPRQHAPRIILESRDTQQTQIALSYRGVGSHDPRRYAVNLLHVILGGNMSSRLFQELREHRGLCYSVSTSLSTHSNCGAFEVALGLDGENVLKALKLIFRECRNIAERGPSKAELRRACDYSIGTSRMALERAATQNYRIGSSLLTYGKILSPEVYYERVGKVTVSEVQKVASQIFQNRTLCLAMVGQGPAEKELMGLIRSEK
ncbi:MAG: insulinase family protein [Verrucomicrobia bacterium]|nr:MAG: insulinase family protein [Verrucomicrobiota bacterium]